MTDDKEAAEGKPEPKKLFKKKAPAKKATPKPAGYVVAAGKALTAKGRIMVEGDTVTAEDVADIEALVKGGFVVKA